MTKEIIKLIEQHNKIALFHHQSIDGDSLSSSYGLLLALKSKYPNKEIKWVAEKEFIQRHFKSLNISFEDAIEEIDSSYLAIVGDVSGLERIYKSEEYQKAKIKICFDHHQNTINHEVEVFWHEPTYPASAIQAFEIAKDLKVNFTEEIAFILLFGIITDTGRFQYSLANPKPLVAASELVKFISNQKIDALYQSLSIKSEVATRFQGYVMQNFKVFNEIAYITIPKSVQDSFALTPEECARVNYLAGIEKIKVWLFFIEYPDYVRVEFRSLGLPVNEIAKKFNGGGHVRASGCKLEKMEHHEAVVFAVDEAIKEEEFIASAGKLAKEEMKNANAIWEIITKHKQVTLFTHIDPDGDTIGSALALKCLIKENHPDIEVKISGDKNPDYLAFLEEAERVSDEFFNNSLKIVIDTSSTRRIFDKRVKTEEAIKIDHHHKENDWLIEIGGDHWPATGEVIYEFARLNNLIMSREFYKYVFIAIWTDTSGLSERALTPDTKMIIDNCPDKEELIAMLNISEKHQTLFGKTQEDIVETGSGAYVIVKEEVLNDLYRPLITFLWQELNKKRYYSYLIVAVQTEFEYRIGFRSKNNFDVSEIAVKFGGGGHRSSAGIRTKDQSNIKEIIDYAKEELRLK